MCLHRPKCNLQGPHFAAMNQRHWAHDSGGCSSGGNSVVCPPLLRPFQVSRSPGSIRPSSSATRFREQLGLTVSMWLKWRRKKERKREKQLSIDSLHKKKQDYPNSLALRKKIGVTVPTISTNSLGPNHLLFSLNQSFNFVWQNYNLHRHVHVQIAKECIFWNAF